MLKILIPQKPVIDPKTRQPKLDGNGQPIMQPPFAGRRAGLNFRDGKYLDDENTALTPQQRFNFLRWGYIIEGDTGVDGDESVTSEEGTQPSRKTRTSGRKGG